MQKTSNNFFDKACSDVIKGVALLLMLVHHFFTFPEWLLPDISYPHLSIFREPTMICVPVFAFLTGYFYFFTKSKTYKYSIRKSTDLWLAYLVVFLLLMSVSLLGGVYQFSFGKLLLELFALNYSTMCFCWYVVFYIMTMLILPLFAKACDKNDIAVFFVTLLICLFCKNIGSVFGYLGWFACVASGYIFAKRSLFYEFSELFSKKHAFFEITTSVLLIFVAMATRLFSSEYDFITAPIFVYGVASVYNRIKHKKLLAPLGAVGKYSLVMWFFHCIFYGSAKAFTQPILYLPKNPVLVFVWGALLCFTSAVIINIPIKYLQKLKNKLLL